MYVDARINMKEMWALVDTRATHNYLASTEVDKLELVVEKEVGQVKAVNSVA